ncbi:MAG: FKBP-type peptidyl-prolyl cis-trans isomerase [Bryobacteraceae bacterium]
MPYAEPQVSGEEIEKRVQELRERKAEFINEDPRPLAEGDFAVVSLQTLSGIEGEPMHNENMVLHLGDSETLPEFTANLTGMSPEEVKEFEVAYPADYGQERLAGRQVRFKVQVKQVRRRSCPS